MSKPKCDFTPLITGITPLYRPAQLAGQDYEKGDPITIVHTFIVEGHHLGEVAKEDVDLGNFSHGFRWKVIDAETLDPCHILVHASVECLEWHTAAAAAGSGDLTVAVNSPPPPPPPPPPGPGGRKKKAKKGKDVRVENAFTVFYLNDSPED